MTSSLVSDEFKTILQQVAEKLTNENVQNIAILCQHSTHNTQEEIKDGMDLFAKLQDLNLLNQDNTTFLVECLDSLQLTDASGPLKLYREKYFDSEYLWPPLSKLFLFTITTATKNI